MSNKIEHGVYSVDDVLPHLDGTCTANLYIDGVKQCRLYRLGRLADCRSYWDKMVKRMNNDYAGKRKWGRICHTRKQGTLIRGRVADAIS